MRRTVEGTGGPIARTLLVLLVGVTLAGAAELPAPPANSASQNAPRLLTDDGRYRVWWEGFEACPKCNRGQHTLALRLDDVGTTASQRLLLDEGFQHNPNYARVAARIIGDRLIVSGVGYAADKVVIIDLRLPFPVMDRRGCDGMSYSHSGAWLACVSEIENRHGLTAVMYQTKVVVSILDLTIPTLPWRVVYPPENVASQSPNPNLPQGLRGSHTLSELSWSGDDRKLVFFESSPRGPQLIELDLSAGPKTPVVYRRRIDEDELTGMTQKERNHGFTSEAIEWLTAADLRVKLPGGYPHCEAFTMILPSASLTARPVCLPHERWEFRRDGETPSPPEQRQ
jgi:hypothetical protein